MGKFKDSQIPHKEKQSIFRQLCLILKAIIRHLP